MGQCANFLNTFQTCRKTKSGHTRRRKSMLSCITSLQSPRLLCKTRMGQSVCPKQIPNLLNLSIHYSSKHSCSQVPAERSLQATFSSAYSTSITCQFQPAHENGKQQVILRVKKYTHTQSYMFYDFHVSVSLISLQSHLWFLEDQKCPSSFLGDQSQSKLPSIESALTTIHGL